MFQSLVDTMSFHLIEKNLSNCGALFHACTLGLCNVYIGVAELKIM